jgi:MFS transporter, SP family, general alpha glucoside:H+ symporter
MAEVTVTKQPSAAHDGWAENIEEELGHVANQEEHEMTALQAIAKWPKVFGWCMFALFATLLVSFENQAAGNVLSIPKFREDFGHYYDGSYVLYTSWQSAFYGGPLAATIISTLCASAVSDKFGRKPTLIGAVLVSFAAIALEFVATTNPQFFGGKFLNGFTTGIIWSVAMSYVGEVSHPISFIKTLLSWYWYVD